MRRCNIFASVNRTAPQYYQVQHARLSPRTKIADCPSALVTRGRARAVFENNDQSSTLGLCSSNTCCLPRSSAKWGRAVWLKSRGWTHVTLFTPLVSVGRSYLAESEMSSGWQSELRSGAKVEVAVLGTLLASLSGTFLQTLPDLVTSLKGHSLSPRSCPPMRSPPSERFGYW